MGNSTNFYRVGSQSRLDENKPGNIYYVRLSTPIGLLYKLGFTTLPSATARLSFQGRGHEKQIDKLLAFVFAPDALALEQATHRHFYKRRAFRVADDYMPFAGNGQSELYVEDVLGLDEGFSRGQALRTRDAMVALRMASTGKDRNAIEAELEFRRALYGNPDKELGPPMWPFSWLFALVDLVSRKLASSSELADEAASRKLTVLLRHAPPPPTTLTKTTTGGTAPASPRVIPRGVIPQPLRNFERAVLIAAQQPEGASLGAAFEDLTWSDVLNALAIRNIAWDRFGDKRDRMEFQISAGTQNFDVSVDYEPTSKGPALIRARPSEAWLDDLHGWFCSLPGGGRESKFSLREEKKLIFGAAHDPECRPDTPTPVPRSIARLQNLEVLGLINCDVTSLPVTMGQMIRLEELKLGGNQLRELPDELCSLYNLKILTLWMNDLTCLPSRLGELRRLEGLDISMIEDLNELPESIVELTSLKRLYMSSPCLELTDDQKSWLVELIRGGTEVTVHEKLVPGLLEREPQLQLLLTQAGCFNIPNTKSR
jgi:hypothetical protein